jgi:hypothetical protein
MAGEQQVDHVLHLPAAKDNRQGSAQHLLVQAWCFKGLALCSCPRGLHHGSMGLLGG